MNNFEIVIYKSNIVKIFTVYFDSYDIYSSYKK